MQNYTFLYFCIYKFFKMRFFNPSNRSQWRVMLAYRDLVRNHFKPVTRRYVERFRQSQLEAAHRLRGKEQLEVAFFLTIPGMWKVDAVFQAMQQDPHYHPYVVIYPYAVYKGYDKAEIQKTLERTKAFVEEKGYEYVIPYDEAKRQ